MDDLMDKIQEVLSDKESMEQIRQLASMLGVSPEDEAPPAKEKPAMPELSALSAIKNLASNSAAGDKNIALLLALKPLHKDESKAKIDRIIRIFRIMALYPLIRDSGILGGDLLG